MTYPNTPVLTQADLRGLPEHLLLQLWCLIYEMEHRKESGRKALVQLAGISEAGVKNFLAGRGNIGGLTWLQIQKQIEVPLYTMWLEANQ